MQKCPSSGRLAIPSDGGTMRVCWRPRIDPGREALPTREHRGESDHATILPLPPGEGWGEGTVSEVNPCRGLVAQHLRRFSVWRMKSIILTPGPSPGGRGEKKVLVLES